MADQKRSSSAAAKAAQPFICAGLSAMFASACVSPMDVTKTRMQVLAQPGKKPSIVAVMRDVAKADGIKGFYAGLSASLLRQAIYGTARIGLHRYFSDTLKAMQEGGGALPAYKSIGSSMLSGALASIVGTPFDVALVRMQSDSLKPVAERRGYKNVFDALARVTREEGVARLWRGFEPTVLRAMAMNVGQLATYDQAKAALVKIGGDTTAMQLSASAIAGLTCVVTSLPFDLLKTRLQNMKAGPDGKMPYTGVVDCAAKIFRAEGPLAFWTGFWAYYGRTAPHAMIILITLEQLNAAYKRAFIT